MVGFEGIKAISFDGDGTLWDFGKVMRDALTKTLEEFRRVYPHLVGFITVEMMVKVRERVGERLKGKVFNLEEIRLEAFRETLKEAGILGKTRDDLADWLNGIYREHRFKNISLFEDVLPTLRVLKPHFTLGLVSNGNTYPQRHGLEEFFSFVVFSQDHGIEKPDPRIFEIALTQAGCQKEEMLHVGDSFDDDVRGGTNVGLRCLWLNRKRRPRPTDIEFKAVIESYSLSELLYFLDLTPQ